MKRLYYLSILALACAISCNKEIAPTTDTTQDDELVEIRISGTLDKELTKTAYDTDGKMTWIDGDQARLIVSQGSNYETQNYNTFTLEASYGDITNEGRTAVFYGLVDKHQNPGNDWLTTGIAVYPASVVPTNNGGNYYGKPYIKMPSTVTGLASSIILAGTPDSETASEVTNFFFKTAMAVLKVTITNIPATATSIRLTTNNDSYPVDGDFTLVKNEGLVSIGLDKYQGYGQGFQNITIPTASDIRDTTVFFNIPVGSYPASTLALEVREGNQVLMKRAISKSLTLERNECLSIPTLTYHRVYIKGAITNPSLYTVNPSSTIRTHISTTKLTATNYVANEWKDGNKFGANQNGWDLTQLKNTGGTAYLSSSNNYYLQYIVCSSDNKPSSLSDANVVAYGSVPFKYMTASEASTIAVADIIGTYTLDLVDYWNSVSSSSLTLAASDNNEKGNIMITNILGQNTSLYGTLASGIVTFSEDQEWYTDSHSAVHRLINNWSGTYTSTWSLKLAAATGVDLTLGNSYLVNFWYTSSSQSYDAIYKNMDCVKQ